MENAYYIDNTENECTDYTDWEYTEDAENRTGDSYLVFVFNEYDKRSTNTNLELAVCDLEF